MRNLLVLSAVSTVLLAADKDAKGGGAKAPLGLPAGDAKAQTPPPNAGHDGPGEIDNEGVDMVRKISPATVIGQVKKPRKPLIVDGKQVTDDAGKPRTVPYEEGEVWPDTPLYVCIGVTHGIRTGTGDNGPWVAFLGAFEAQRFADGKRFQGGQCFVPKAVEDVMVATLNATRKSQGETGAGAGAIEFGIEVGVKHSLTQIGYEYYVKNLVKTQGTDPLALLRGKTRPMLTGRMPNLAEVPAQAALPQPVRATA